MIPANPGVVPANTQVIAIGPASAAERKKIARILGKAGYAIRTAEAEEALRDAAGDSRVCLIVIDADEHDPEIAYLVNRLYDACGPNVPPILMISVRDPRGPDWLPLLFNRTVYYFQRGYADEELRIITRMLVQAFLKP